MAETIRTGYLTWTKGLANAPKNMGDTQRVVVWDPIMYSLDAVEWLDKQPGREEGWYSEKDWAPIPYPEKMWWTIITLPGVKE